MTHLICLIDEMMGRDGRKAVAGGSRQIVPGLERETARRAMALSATSATLFSPPRPGCQVAVIDH